MNIPLLKLLIVLLNGIECGAGAHHRSRPEISSGVSSNNSLTCSSLFSPVATNFPEANRRTTSLPEGARALPREG